MKFIELTRGCKAMVDDQDFDWINQYSWHCIPGKRTAYASRCYTRNGKRIHEGMHTTIHGGDMIDHIDGDGLNNQRSNLRLCTDSLNGANRRPNKGKRFKGITFMPSYKKWMARVQVQKKRFTIGFFDSEFDAAKAYNESALKAFGEYARLNEV